MRRTKEDAELTKQAILDAAVDVFSERGVAKASLEEIAKKADVTRGAVYWHFKNKMEIFEALHDRLHTPFIEKVMEGLEAEHPDPVGQLQEVCINLLLEVELDPNISKTLNLFLLKCDYAGEFQFSKEKYNRIQQEKLNAFSGYFRKAIDMGKLNASANPYTIALAVICYLRGIVIEYLDSPEEFDLQNQANDLVKLFFKGLQAE